MLKNVTNSIIYVGASDNSLDLFEGQYPIPNGMAYNSYVVMDEKIAVMDAVDEVVIDEWLKNVEEALNGKKPDYLVVNHVEPDHSAGIKSFLEKFPETQVVVNAQIARMLPQFGVVVEEGKQVVVKEGDTLSLGSHEFSFIMAPMESDTIPSCSNRHESNLALGQKSPAINKSIFMPLLYDETSLSLPNNNPELAFLVLAYH